MDNRTNMLLFISLTVLSALTFVFGLDALVISSVKYGVISLIGYLICLGFSIFESALLKKDGSPLLLWFRVYTIVVGIVFVWYLTRCGTAFGWW
jgi:hypothetical protein